MYKSNIFTDTGSKIFKNNLEYVFTFSLLTSFFIIIITLFKTPAILIYSRKCAFIQPGSDLNLRDLCLS